jgi:hypothetical protein
MITCGRLVFKIKHSRLTLSPNLNTLCVPFVGPAYHLEHALQHGEMGRGFSLLQIIITDTMSTHPPLIETLSIGDKSIVVGQSKHRGCTASVKKVGKCRLTVRFHGKQKGKYVDCDNVRLIDNAITVTGDEEVSNLSAVLEQLAITTTTAIKSHEPAKRKQLLRDFIQSLNQHLRVMVQQDKI